MSVRVGGTACFVAVFLSALAWSVTNPPFLAPDEPLHFAYVQRIAETGRPPSSSEVGRKALSSEAETLFSATGAAGVLGNRLAKLPANEVQQEALDSQLSTKPSKRDGGGALAYANSPPGYYALAALPYLAAEALGTSPLGVLAFVRLFSCLLTALTALFVFLFVRELVPSCPAAWVPAALSVGLLPYVGFIGSSVNSDALLTAAAAATFAALARSFRRGIDGTTAIIIGLAASIGVVAKPTFLGLLPGVVLGCGFLLARAWRRRGGFPLRELAALIATPAAVGAVYLGVTVGLWGRPVLPAASGIGAASTADPAAKSFKGFLSFLLQTWLPRPPFLTDQVQGQWPLNENLFKGFVGRFGWLDYDFPQWVYRLVLLAWLVLLAGAARSAYLVGKQLRGRASEFLTYLVMTLGLIVVIAVPSYDYRLTTGFAFEQGRYLFPLLALLGGLYALGIKGFGPRFAPYAGVALVVATICLDFAGLFQTVARYYIG